MSVETSEAKTRYSASSRQGRSLFPISSEPHQEGCIIFVLQRFDARFGVVFLIEISQ
jgi:hypothetical protein